MKNLEELEKIDFVITWVDGGDPDWQAQKEKYQPGKGSDASKSRYRDWDNLQFWFRGVEQFAPWVNQIFFVTWGHLPSWLNVNHPKLRIVTHWEFMKPEYLPTFNINPIELNLHRIPGLAEQFVFFNDDMFLIQPMKPTDFFQNGLPRDCCLETALAQDDINNPFAHILLNDAALVNQHFKKRKVIKKNWKKWFAPAYGSNLIRNLLLLPYQEFSSFKYTHLPSPFLKKTYEQVWEMEGEKLDEICRNRFRTVFDVNQYIMKYWQYMNGNYIPQSPKIGRFYTIGKEDAAIAQTIRAQKCKMICLNDDVDVGDFERQKQNIRESFSQILPHPSSFELSDGQKGGRG